jgi:hypothetical protein
MIHNQSKTGNKNNTVIEVLTLLKNIGDSILKRLDRKKDNLLFLNKLTDFFLEIFIKWNSLNSRFDE